MRSSRYLNRKPAVPRRIPRPRRISTTNVPVIVFRLLCKCPTAAGARSSGSHCFWAIAQTPRRRLESHAGLSASCRAFRNGNFVVRLPLPPLLRRSARKPVDAPMNPSHTSANASAGRRGAWFSTGTRDGTQQPLWSSPPRHPADDERQRARGEESERVPRTPSWKLRWLAVLIAIGGAVIALMLVTSSPA